MIESESRILNRPHVNFNKSIKECWKENVKVSVAIIFLVLKRLREGRERLSRGGRRMEGE